MTDRGVDVFFYGLFVDIELLRERGMTPVDARRAELPGWALCIGKRATLVPSSDSRSYGMLVTLTQDELDRLYSAPGLEHYRPEPVLVHTLDGSKRVPATCYNLAEGPGANERDLGYAAQLQALLRRLGFPASYVDSVR